MDRAEREKKAYNEDNVWEKNHQWHVRFLHVFQCPNTIRLNTLFFNYIKERALGKKVLDIGCGYGESSQSLFDLGAGYVHGIDISEIFVSEAKKREVPRKLEFSLQNIMEPMDGKYDIIIGQSILHHVDYKDLLKRLGRDNLNPGGFMIFMEPLGSSLMLKLYRTVSKGAHTPDERPFFREDLNWLKENFGKVEIIPVNYFSLPAGILSTYFFKLADNLLLRVCDKIDWWLGQNVKFLIPSFRQAIFIIRT